MQAEITKCQLKLQVFLSFFLTFRLSFFLSFLTCLSFCLSFRLSFFLSFFTCLSFFLSFFLSFSPSVFLSVFLCEPCEKYKKKEKKGGEGEETRRKTTKLLISYIMPYRIIRRCIGQLRVLTRVSPSSPVTRLLNSVQRPYVDPSVSSSVRRLRWSVVRGITAPLPLFDRVDRLRLSASSEAD